MSPVLLLVISASCALAATLLVVWSAGRKHADEKLAAARSEAKASVQRGELEAGAARRSTETEARTESLELRAQADTELATRRDKLTRREERVSGREAAQAEVIADLDHQHGEIDERFNVVKSQRDRARGLRKDVEQRKQQARELLQEISGVSADSVIDRIAAQWLEDERAAAAHRVRRADLATPGPEEERAARRFMEIASSRYENHFLTERNNSRLPISEPIRDMIMADSGRVHEALQKVANVQMHLSDDGDHLRLEGLDGVGREVARRSINALVRKSGAMDKAKADPEAWATLIRERLQKEIVGLGRKAFTVLGIKRPAAEIVGLVGALNYRTSYTQNQWRHAVEASFLAGMIAEEMRLDLKLARRATLMHDIGKALTHEIEGSHAVIGADIARRLGEDELVANAIGAHHLDEPMNSAYAFLVAAADAMSGARPGARREQTDGYSTRLDDLERIGKRHRGVDRAFAVHGGRELRVYVRENNVSDLDAIELSGSIAEQVSDEMTFPGQIKVTVIRAFEAVAEAN